jgi:hypothetical protein
MAISNFRIYGSRWLIAGCFAVRKWYKNFGRKGKKISGAGKVRCRWQGNRIKI